MPRPPKPWYWKARDRWYVTVGGRRHELARGKAARAEAAAEFHRLMAARGRDVAPERLTCADLFDLFLDHVHRAVGRGERSRHTYDGYVRHLSGAAACFGATRVSDLRPLDVNRWVEDPARGWGPTTRHGAVTAVKAAAAWARREGLVREDPVRDMRKPTPRRREAVLTDDQVRAVLDDAGPGPWHDLITALWESGCRPSEITTLTADRVDLARGVWWVRNKTRQKTGRELRPVPLNPVLAALSARLCERHPEGPVFRNERGRPWTRNAMACRFKRIRARLGLGPEATAYAIRHRYAMEGLRKGLDSSELAALLGHTSVNMINNTYGHWDRQAERLREAAARVRPGGSGPDGPVTPPDLSSAPPSGASAP